MNGLESTYFQTLLNVTNVLYSQKDTKGFWRAIAQHIRRVVRWERAGITLYQPESDAFQWCAVETSLPKIVLHRDVIIPRMGSAVGWVYDHRKIHIRPYLQDEQVFVEDKFYCEEGLGRVINIPLIIRDTCLGTLNIGSVQSGYPDPDDVNFLQVVATQIALAMDHVAAYEQVNCLRKQLAAENSYLHEEIRASNNFGAMVGNSPEIMQVQELGKAVALTEKTVLITGEAGTGKELLARFIHEVSPRAEGPFIRVNCVELPSELFEHELFGLLHEGTLSGVHQDKPGRFELAHGGTLFLDEVGELPLEVQARLLRVLLDGMIGPFGNLQSASVDVRIIAATHKDLESAVVTGQFRADLYYQLHGFSIAIPPLRNRPSDIPLLARHFMDSYRTKLRQQCQDIEEESLEKLVGYSWPGNIRELQNVIERAMMLSSGPYLKIDAALLPFVQTQPQPITGNSLRDVEKREIIQALQRTEGKINGPSGAATMLGLHPNTLRSRLKKLGISRSSLSFNVAWTLEYLCRSFYSLEEFLIMMNL